MDLISVACFMFGFAIAIAILVFAMRHMNSDKKLCTKYDERQLRARGNAFKYGFYAMLIACAIFMMLEQMEFLAVLGSTSYFILLIIGVITQFSYAIFKDAYIGINTKASKFIVFMALIGLFNLGIGALICAEDGFIVDGVLGSGVVNLICGGMCVILLSELAIKKVIDTKAS